MTIWEYLMITEPANLGMSTVQSHLSKAGSEGWELCAVLGLTFIFKREIRMIQQ